MIFLLILLTITFSARVGYRAAKREVPASLMILEGTILGLFWLAVVFATL
jgi:hypothetical protein